MKKINTNLEILLQPDSSFFQKDWCESQNNGHSKKFTQKEQLIQLCWNGILNEMIPELFETSAGKNPLTLWEINETEKLLDLRYGELGQLMNDEWAINPYVVSGLAIMN